MALHRVTLPKSARELNRIVAMQRLLLKALCVDPIDPDGINEAWLLGVWNSQDVTWIKKFCRKRKFSILEPLVEIAKAPLNARQALYVEFCRQNRVRKLLDAGGQFCKLDSLAGVTPDLASEVHKVFIRFYEFLSHEANAGWNGYEFPDGRSIRNESYKNALDESNRPELAVCPYCDGSNDEPDLDHYYSKETFPFLSCSPWNLVPACWSCNKATAKGKQLALTVGVAEPTAEWLHPFIRPASIDVEIRLIGDPKNSIPHLHSPDPAEQKRLENHSALVRTLGTRWTKVVTASFDQLVRDVNNWVVDTGESIETVVARRLRDHKQGRGRVVSSMVHAAVCQAVLDHRPEYVEEFAAPNAPTLD